MLLGVDLPQGPRAVHVLTFESPLYTHTCVLGTSFRVWQPIKYIYLSIYLSVYPYLSIYLSIYLSLAPHAASPALALLRGKRLSLSLAHTHAHAHAHAYTHTHTHTHLHTHVLSLSLTHTHGTKERPSRPAPELEPFWPLEPFPPSRSSCPPPLMSASVSRIACTLGV